jgi:hypothetical protein
MQLTSFSSFVSACLTLVFSSSGINSDEVQLEQLLSEFLEFVQEHTLTEIAYEQFATDFRYVSRGTQYNQMYDNFALFLDFALKNIHCIDAQTLYNGLLTQTTKFKTMYDSLENFNCGGYGYYCSCCCNSLSFYDVIWQIQMTDYNTSFVDLEIYIENEIADILDSNLKQLNANTRTRKTRGQRKDYEQYKFNKGLIPCKRQRITQKSRKNKKDRDFSV